MGEKQTYIEVLSAASELCVPLLRAAQQEFKEQGHVATRDLRGLDGWFAHVNGFLFKLTGDVRYAELARDALLLEQNHGGFTPVWAVRGYRYIADSPVLGPAEREAILQSFVTTADARPSIPWGSAPNWNATLINAIDHLTIAKLLPDHPHAAAWASLVDKYVGDWLMVGDVAEDAINYEPLVLLYIILYAELAGREREIYLDRNFKAAAERYLAIVPPVGVMPDYGDSSWGVEWGMWVAVLQKLAAVYRDGRFKWVAHRYMDFVRDEKLLRNVDTVQKLQLDFNCLPCAYEWCADDIPPVQPTIGSTVAYRTLFKVNFAPELEPTYRIEWTERREDKLVLRTGWKPEDTYVCINLQGRVGHDHSDGGAIVTYTAGGAVLLHDTSYIQRHHEFHNLLFVQQDDAPFARPPWPHSGERFNYKPQMKYRVEFPHTVLAAFEEHNYFGYPITHTRALLFDKAGAPVAVHDRALIHEGSYRLGPLYHVAQVVSQGEHHFCTEQGAPYHHHGLQLTGKPARLVIALPLATGALEQFAQDVPPQPFRYQGIKRGLPDAMFLSFNNNRCLYQMAPAQAGEHLNFLTLLAPQSVEAAPDAWAETVQVLADGPVSSCVRYALGAGEAIVGFRGDGPVTTAPVETDAASFYLRSENGQTTISFHEATYLRVHGQEIFHTLDWPADKKWDVSRYFRIPSALSGELTLSGGGLSGWFYSYEYLEPGIPVGEVEVALAAERTPAHVLVNGQPAELVYDEQSKLAKLTVRGKTFFEWL